MGLFSKKKNDEFNKITKTSAELVVFTKLESTSDDKLLEIADSLIINVPHVVNFDLQSIDDINKGIAFLSGVTYALEGEVNIIGEKIFAFASKAAHEDGSLKIFLNQYASK